MVKILSSSVLLFAILLLPHAPAQAIEPLQSTELESMCEAYQQQPSSTEARLCIRYIKGFIDGAIAIDANIAKRQIQSDGVTSRAMQTRTTARYSTTSNSDFCLGSPVAIEDVVINVVDWLAQHDIDNVLAWVSVHQALKASYPCPG
ncbi:Rap1a/Tai family immunity protein [Thalassotalea litorea]|uniref:Rap1a/Tai family immunity protein n=1 Tax=Thalassotalea litorea TaxID=2020715 RepID=UPI001484F84A|nr:Rap1a/Tai family immunity protein [Thalassotalea litorea]